MSQLSPTAVFGSDSTSQRWYTDLHARRPLLVVISGPSGVGKDATIKRMKERGYPCHFVVTATTRAIRPGEVDGVDYHFVTDEAFAQLLANGELLEHAKVYGQHKGIPMFDVRQALESGHDAVLRVDVQGAASIRHMVPQAVTIFLTAESEDELIERLRRRRTEDEAQLHARITTARGELLRVNEFKYRVLNRECALDEAVEQVIAIMQAEKCRVDWEPVQL
jgi:guanylate kinase